MRSLMVCLALLAAALITNANAPAEHIHNSVSRENTNTKVRPVQAELPRKEATLSKEQEKAQTNQEAIHEPEIVREAAAVETPAPQPLTDKEQLMQQAGISQSDWAATDYIVSHESSWITTNTNPKSGAYGLCQALPASKMASAGDDYISNPVTQLKWCHDYADNRYGGWWSSFAFWRSNNWW